MKHFLIITLLLVQSASAHHGQDFFVNLDARVPTLGSFTTFASASYVRDDFGGEETSLEPGFLVGTGLGTSIGLTAEWSNSDESPFKYSAITPLFQWSIAIPDSNFRLGFAASYNISDSSSLASSATTAAGHTHAAATSISVTPSSSLSFNPDAPAFNPDAPPSGGTGHDHGTHNHSSHSGIHRHGEDFLASRLIVEWQANESTRAVANLIVVSGGWSDIDFGYSLGLRHDFNHHWAAGIEAIGDLNSNGEHEVVAGAWLNPRHDLNFRLGLGTGIGGNSPELAVYSGLTWRF